MKILIAAAGTGGHINPGIAIANKIKKEHPRAEIFFVGTTRGLENDLVPRAGYPLKTIEVYGIKRKISVDNFKKIIKTLRGFKEAKQLLKELEPDVVIGTGGYICGPIGMAATKANIPTVLHESNAFPGATVRLLSKRVDEILLGFSEAKSKLPKAKKLVVTGTPTKVKRLELDEERRKEIKKNIGLKNDKPIVLIFGGSQGAKKINDAIINIIKDKRNKDYQILWAPGKKQYDYVKEEFEKLHINMNNIEGVKIVPYIYNMEEAMEVADLQVSRSGALTITEVSITGIPSIFIPLAIAAENHQEYNARVLADKGGAEIILEENLTSETLGSKIEEIINDKNKLNKMRQINLANQPKDVEEKIYNEIKKYLK